MLLITGVTGYVGKSVWKILETEERSIRVVARRPAFDGLRNNIEWVVVDNLFTLDESSLRELLCGVDTVLHVAWYAEHGKYLDSLENMMCVEGTLRMARIAVEAGVSHFVGVGTCLEYEQGGDVLTTSTALNPLSLYASSKCATYYMLRSLFKFYDVAFSWARLFYIYGGEEAPTRLHALLHDNLSKKMPVSLGPADVVRDYLHVDSVAKHLVNIVDHRFVGDINICSGDPTTIGEIAVQIAHIYGASDLLSFANTDTNASLSYVLGEPSL